MTLVKRTMALMSGGGVRPGAFDHGRRLLGLVPLEDALGAVELAGHVIGVVVDLPGRAPQRVVGDVRSKHPPFDAGGLDDVPDRLIVPIEVVGEPDEIEAGIAGARALPVDDPGEGAVVAGEDVVGVQVQVHEPVGREPRRVCVGADGLHAVEHRRTASTPAPQRLVHRPPVHADGERVHDGRTPWAQVRRRQRTGDTGHGGDALDHLLQLRPIYGRLAGARLARGAPMQRSGFGYRAAIPATVVLTLLAAGVMGGAIATAQGDIHVVVPFDSGNRAIRRSG